MRRAPIGIFLLSGGLLLAGPAFGAKEPPPKKPALTEHDQAEALYKKADKSFTRGYYDDAIAQFEKLKNTYPFDHYAVEAELKIADAYYKKREFGDAADAYRTFAKLHPKHEKVDYATFRVGLSLFEEAPKSVDRDQSSTEKALEELRTFITEFPDSKYADEAAKKVGEGRDRLAAKELYVGQYYVKHHKWKAAVGRLESVVAHYPDSASAEEATFLLGEAQFRSGKKDEAKDTLTQYLDRYPNGDDARAARKLLARLGVGIPKPTPRPAATPASTPTPTPAAAASPSPTPSE